MSLSVLRFPAMFIPKLSGVIRDILIITFELRNNPVSATDSSSGSYLPLVSGWTALYKELQ